MRSWTSGRLARQRGAPGHRRAVFTLADQGLSSVSNFAVGVVVAKLSGPAGLGVFTLAYALWQFLVTQHRSLVTDPMAIEGDARTSGNVRGVVSGLAAELIIGTCAGVGLVVLGLVLRIGHQSQYGTAVLAIAPWLPALVIQDYWRWIGFMTARPLKALVNDLVFNLVEVATFLAVLLTGLRSGPIIIAAWGSAAFAAAVFGLAQFNLLRPSAGRLIAKEGGRSLWRFFTSGAMLLHRRWRIGRWIAGNDVLNWVESQGFILIAGVILGPVGLGGLKAAQQLVLGPASVLVQAGGSLGLPEASRAYHERGWAGLTRVARLITAVGVGSVGAMTVVMLLAGRFLLSTVYGPQFARFHWAAVLTGAALTLWMFGQGPLLVIKVTRNTKYLIQTAGAGLPFTVGGAAVFSRLYGVNGAATAFFASALINAVGARWFQHRCHQSIRAQVAAVAPVPDPALRDDAQPAGASAVVLPRARVPPRPAAHARHWVAPSDD